jgi:hypothetical protein
VLKCGIGGAIIATVIMGYVFSILARTVAAFSRYVPGGGNAVRFVRLGLGQRAADITSSMEVIKLLCVICALILGIVSYLAALAEFSHIYYYAVYAALFSSLITYSSLGTTFSGVVQIAFTSACLALLLFYWISAGTIFSFSRYAQEDSKAFENASNFLLSFPYACWFFLGFEELPTVAGASADKNTLTTASALCFFTVLASGLFTLILAASAYPGITDLKNEGAPLIPGLEHVYGENSWIVGLFSSLSILALLNPLFSFVLYSGHQIQVTNEYLIFAKQLIYFC